MRLCVAEVPDWAAPSWIILASVRVSLGRCCRSLYAATLSNNIAATFLIHEDEIGSSECRGSGTRAFWLWAIAEEQMAP